MPPIDCIKQIFSIEAHKRAFDDVWIQALRLPLSMANYKRVLGAIPQRVLPYLHRPVLLMDFLTDSYNVGMLVAQIKPYQSLVLTHSLTHSLTHKL